MSPSRFTWPRAACTVFLVLAAGCDRAPAPQGEAAPQAPAAAQAPAATAPAELREFGETLLWADPLSSCSDGQTTTIHWSKEAVAQGPASIELGDENPGIFARVGDEGRKETGPWAYPGAVVTVRGDDGALRARLVMKGPGDCVSVSASTGANDETGAAPVPTDSAAAPSVPSN